jgi:hypothetical protein
MAENNPPQELPIFQYFCQVFLAANTEDFQDDDGYSFLTTSLQLHPTMESCTNALQDSFVIGYIHCCSLSYNSHSNLGLADHHTIINLPLSSSTPLLYLAACFLLFSARQFWHVRFHSKATGWQCTTSSATTTTTSSKQSL